MTASTWDAVAFVRAIATLPPVNTESAWRTLENIRQQAKDLDAQLASIITDGPVEPLVAHGENK